MKRYGKLPDAIENAPELQPGLELYWDAFFDLNSCRTHGMGTITEIPWSAIDAYARRYEIEGFLFDRLVAYISAMDASYLKFLRDKVDKK